MSNTQLVCKVSKVFLLRLLPPTENSSKLGTKYMVLQQKQREQVSQGSRLYPSLSLCCSKVNITWDLEEGPGQVRARVGRKPLPRLLILPTVYCKSLILNKFVYGCGQQFTNLDSIWSGLHVCGLVGERMTGCVCAVPGRAGQGRAAWVCAHKGCVWEGSGGICVPSEWKCEDVREAAGKERRDGGGPSGCAEVLQLSGNICCIREKLSKRIFCPQLKALQAWFCPTQNHHFNCFSLMTCHG